MALERLTDEQVVAQYSEQGTKMTALVQRLLMEFGGAKFPSIELPEGQTFPNTIDAAAHDEAADLAATISQLRANREAAVRSMLQRIQQGTYGQCTSCLKGISFARLQAMPEAEECVPCKTKSERR